MASSKKIPDRIQVGSASLPFYEWSDPKTGKTYFRWSWKDSLGKWRYGTRANLAEALDSARAQARSISQGRVNFDSLTDAQIDLVKQFIDLNPSQKELDQLREWRTMSHAPVKLAVDRWHAMKLAELPDAKESPHLKIVRQWLEKFAGHFGAKPAASITVDEMRAYIEAGATGQKSRRDFRARLVALWSFARDQELFTSREADKLPSYRAAVSKTVSVWKPEELAKMLKDCPAPYLPWLVISNFSGARSEEIAPKHGTKPPMTWDMVKRKQGIIDLPAECSKVRKRRLIPITETLEEWFDYLDPPKTGLICHSVPSSGITAQLGKLIGGWRKNDSRHSYGSYRAAVTKDLPALAIEMGTSYAMIESHYREVVPEETAKEFWRLTPSEVFRK